MASRQETQTMLDLTTTMRDDSRVYCYQSRGLADPNTLSVFLAGPSSREDILEYKWRAFAVHYLRSAGFEGIIYIPEPRENDWTFKETFQGKIVAWESERLLSASLAFVWLPRHQTQLPGRVTNTELGFLAGMAYADPDKFKDRFIFGCPPDAWKINSETHWAGLAGTQRHTDLKEMCESAAGRLNNT